MSGPPPIAAVVFDVGHVLVDADYGPFLRLLEDHGVRANSMDEACERIGLAAHEAGRLGADDFLDRIDALAVRRFDRARLLAEWNGMYRAVEPMLALARGLAATHRVHLLSNMGEIHWAHLEAAFGIPSLGHGAVASWEARCLKPEPAIYAEAERRFALRPAHTLFVDDRADNCAAAIARGWRAIRHVSPERTRRELATLGLPV
ncbi:MAG: HAD-IA family hydrolase [Steroidobacteraceae bacterium]|nr:HAD-IA family hydrolase [Steroidobacteraceae bacterium]